MDLFITLVRTNAFLNHTFWLVKLKDNVNQIKNIVTRLKENGNGNLCKFGCWSCVEACGRV